MEVALPAPWQDDRAYGKMLQEGRSWTQSWLSPGPVEDAGPSGHSSLRTSSAFPRPHPPKRPDISQVNNRRGSIAQNAGIGTGRAKVRDGDNTAKWRYKLRVPRGRTGEVIAIASGFPGVTAWVIGMSQDFAGDYRNAFQYAGPLDPGPKTTIV